MHICITPSVNQEKDLIMNHYKLILIIKTSIQSFSVKVI